MGVSYNYKRLIQWNCLVAQKKITDKTKNEQNVPSLPVLNLLQREVVLVHCDLVDNQYQPKSGALYTFTPNKSYASFLNVEPSNLVFLKLITLSLMKLL